MANRIIVATDGRPGATGALRLARLLEERGAVVEVLTVFEPTDLYLSDSPYAVANLPTDYYSDAIEALRGSVRTQLHELGDRVGEWPLHVEVGPVERTIATFAAKRGASMILLGLREPGKFERWLARNALLRLIHLAHVPVLAVPESQDRLPFRVVMGVDFTDFSRRAARETTWLMEPGGQLHLVHVSWAPHWESTDLSSWTEWEGTYRAGVKHRLEELAGQLDGSADLTIEAHILSGPVGAEILRLAERLDADLIAAGSHGAGFFGRIVMGSVSTELVHRARCALLLAPPPTIPSELGLEGLTERELLGNLGTAGDLALSDVARTR